MTRNLLLITVLLSSLQSLTGCSLSKLTVYASMPMIDGGFIALNRETDLLLAESAMPANIEIIEGLLINDPDNEKLRIYASQAYYGYSYGFVEDNQRDRAANLYYRGFKHALHVLNQYGISENTLNSSTKALEQKVSELDQDSVPALFWTASCLAKWVDMTRDSTESIAKMPVAVILMQKTLELDEHFNLSGPNLFFAVYYGSKPPMLGGDYNKSEFHFDRASTFNSDKLLLVDLLKSQYLYRQRFDKELFNQSLNKIINSQNDLYPEQALINIIARKKAYHFLQLEDQWF